MSRNYLVNVNLRNRGAQSLIVDCDNNKAFYVQTWQRHEKAMLAVGGTKGQSRKTSKQSWEGEGDLRMTNHNVFFLLLL